MGLTLRKIAREIQALLELPVNSWDHDFAPAMPIVNTIFDSMAAALRRGERVEIRGLGAFTLRERKPVRRKLTYFYGRRSGPAFIRTLKAKKYVHFQPEASIIKALNEQPQP